MLCHVPSQVPNCAAVLTGETGATGAERIDAPRADATGLNTEKGFKELKPDKELRPDKELKPDREVVPNEAPKPKKGLNRLLFLSENPVKGF